MFAVASGVFGKSELAASKQERTPTPCEILHEFVHEEVPRCQRLVGASQKDFELKPEHIDTFKAWVLSGCPNFQTALQKGWVPKEALIDSMNGMTIQMPPPIHKGIRGSEADEHIDIQDVPAARIITAKRARLR